MCRKIYVMAAAMFTVSPADPFLNTDPASAVTIALRVTFNNLLSWFATLNFTLYLSRGLRHAVLISDQFQPRAHGQCCISSMAYVGTTSSLHRFSILPIISYTAFTFPFVFVIYCTANLAFMVVDEHSLTDFRRAYRVTSASAAS